MYLRRWTKMRTLDLIRVKYERKIIDHHANLMPILRYPAFDITIRESAERGSPQDNALYSKLFSRYPDLKYIPLKSYIEKGATDPLYGDLTLEFVKRWKQFMVDGFDQETAFRKTEKMYQERFAKKIDDHKLTEMVALNNRARSFLTTSQQHAEVEARLKVERLERDLAIYKQSEKKLQKSMNTRDNLSSVNSERPTESQVAEALAEYDYSAEGEEEHTDITEEDIEAHNPKNEHERNYVRVLHKIIPRLSKNKSNYLSKEKRTEIVDEFLKNTKNLFRIYYERAAAFDRLSGLKDDQIINQLVGTPKRIKKYTKDLRKKLHKYNIKLDSAGNVDYSQCPHTTVIDKLKTNPYVKIALMLEDLQFESPHLELQQQLARKLKIEFDEFQVKERERYEQSEEYLEQKAKEEYHKSLQSAFDKSIDFHYEDEATRKEKEGDKNRKAALEDRKHILSQIGQGDFMNSPFATYKIFETIEEKRARLEKKWLENRLSALEGGVDKPSVDEQKELINNAVEKLRRIKYKVDQVVLSNTQKLLFEEHKVFSKEELLLDANEDLETMEAYLRQPDEKRRTSARDDIDDERITRLITRTDVVEDTIKPFEDWKYKKIRERDSINVKDFIRREKDIEMAEKLLRVKSDDAGESAANMIESEEVQLGDKSGKGKKKEVKAERKKLVDYIRKVSVSTKEK